MNKDLAQYYGAKNTEGVLIAEVIQDSPAEKAKLRNNDIILSVAGKKIRTSKDLVNIIAQIKPGKKVEINVLRNRKSKSFQVRIDQMAVEQQIITAKSTGEFGIQVANMNPSQKEQLARFVKYGVIVSAVEPGSKGYQAGVRIGDVILEINHQEVRSVSDFNKIIKRVKKGRKATTVIFRTSTGLRIVTLKK